MENSRVQYVIGVSALAVIGTCAAIILLGHAARKPEEPLQSPAPKTTTLVGSDPTVRIPGESAAPRTPAPAPREDPLRQMHRHQLNETFNQLQELLDLTEEQRRTVEEAFREEETAWRRLLDTWLEQAKPQTPDEYAAFFDPPYPHHVTEITRKTDARIKAVLTETQWQAFSDWRPLYNKRRFFWHEED